MIMLGSAKFLPPYTLIMLISVITKLLNVKRYTSVVVYVKHYFTQEVEI